MSRVGDLAAVLSVLGKVLSKSAALRALQNEQKWKTSSIMRSVGQVRQERPSYDNFETYEESPTAEKSKDHSLDSYGHETIQTAAINETNEGEDEMFVLRSARQMSSMSGKVARKHAANSFRADPNVFKPTQADRYNIRAGSQEVVASHATEPWRPQAAIDTTLSASDSAIIDDEPTSIASDSAKDQADINLTNASTATSYAANGETMIDDKASHGLMSSAVPTSRLSRLYFYGSLGASLGFNAFTDSAKRILNGPSGESSGLLSSRNTDLLVKKLSRMRGAALKLGQMISFQDENLPGPIREVLQRVQDAADYMPAWQLDQVMTKEFSSTWRDLFAEFDDIPIAAASIGQVHRARLPDGRKVAVKVQYPGVANSISSDLNNLSLLLTATRLLPKGLYLDKTIANARTELAWECDYLREAENTRQFAKYVKDDGTFRVPAVIDECSGKQVLTTEYLEGVGIAKSKTYSQELRNFLGASIMRMCLREVAEFRFMQTDPNWTNFLYNDRTKQIELLDFGACRSFDPTFIDNYCKLLVAAANGNTADIKYLSTELGYLTGAESSTMIEAHTSSILALSEPFSLANPNDLYDFEGQTVTERVKSFIPVMLRERLAPPPEETYSLHRRLSGHFLLCSRMRSKIPCKQIFTEVMTKAGYM